MVGTVDDRDRYAPVALSRDQPVAEPVGDGAPADAPLLRLGGDGLEGLPAGHSAVGTGVDRVSLVQLQDRALHRPGRPGRAAHDLLDREPVFAGEGKIAGVVARDAHDGSGGIGHEHVVRDPDRNPFSVPGIDRVGTGEDAGLLVLGREPLDLGFAAGPLHVGFDGVPLGRGGDPGDQGMLGGQHHEGDPEDRVRAGGEDPDRLLSLDREGQLRPVAATDPVGLHDPDPLRPPIQLVQVVEQTVGVGGDLEEPLLQVLLGGPGPASPADAVDDLLVGQHGVVLGTPVDRGHPLVGEAPLVELEEEPLSPAIVIRAGSRDLAVPGEADAHDLQLVLRDGDVLLDRDPRGNARLDGGVLSRKPEGVPAEGVQDVVAAHQLVAGEGIAEDVVAKVPHVERPRRIGEHHHVEELGAAAVLGHAENPGPLPGGPPLGLDQLRIVDGCNGFGHG